MDFTRHRLQAYKIFRRGGLRGHFHYNAVDDYVPADSKGGGERTKSRVTIGS